MSQYLYAIVLTLNALDHVKRLIRALASTQVATRVIAIDNGSTDGTRDWLAEAAKTSGLIYVPNEGNIGVARGWNLGIRIAIANGAQAMLIAGHDTWPMPGAVERLILLLQEGVPFITGTAVAYETPEASCTALTKDCPLLAAPDFSFFAVTTRTIELLAVHEAKTGVQVSPWELGIFDGQFLMSYWEDQDYHMRLHQAGLLAARDPFALFRHDCSLTLRNNPEIAKLNQTTFPQNAELFRKKYGALPHQLDRPPQARPLNVGDAEWQQMSGGREVRELPRDEVIAQAKAVYAQYGIVG